MTEKQFDRWFRENIVEAAKALWGTGWARLSEDAQITEVQARVAVNIMGSGRLEAPMTPEDAAALGRHVEKMTGAFRRWAAARG